jgi:hypothetical protein
MAGSDSINFTTEYCIELRREKPHPDRRIRAVIQSSRPKTVEAF